MLFLIALRNMIRNRRRTVAIILTLAIGCAALFCFDGFNQGIMNQYRSNTIRAHYGYGQVFTNGYYEAAFEKPWHHWIENGQKVGDHLLAIDGVEQVFPRVSFYALLTNGEVSVAGNGFGIDAAEESTFFHSINVIEGENLTTQQDGIILGKGLAKALAVKPGDSLTLIGNTLDGSINGLDLVVTGIFHTGSKDFDDKIFKIQIEQAQTLLETKSIESFSLGLRAMDFWRNVQDTVDSLFPDLEAIPFATLDKVYYQHSVDWLKSQFGVIKAIILTIVILGIFNTISTAVFDRKREIGNLRANGESRWKVMCLLLTEGALQGLFGGCCGVLIGWVVVAFLLPQGILMPPAPGITKQFHVLIELQPTMVGVVILLGLLCSLISTFFAGVRVIRKPIAELLRAV